MAKDYYTTLNVPRTASQEEIKKAYRKLAHEHHPDKKSGNEAKFKEINEAYQVLSDSKKRSNYDNFGFAYNDGGYQGGSNGGFDFNQSNFWDFFRGQSQGQTSGYDDLFDMFSDVFGGNEGFRQQKQEDVKGENLYIEVEINKKDLGSTRMIEYEALDICNECSGSGAARGYSVIECKNCHGAGQVRQTSRSGMGMFSRVSVCSVCHGRGSVIEKECPKCKANGRIKAKRKLEIRLPEKLENSYSIAIPHGGNAGKNGQPSGDLVVNIQIR